MVLTVEECYELGKLSYNNEDFYHTTLWMEQAVDLLGRDIKVESKRAEMLDYLAFSYYKVKFTHSNSNFIGKTSAKHICYKI